MTASVVQLGGYQISFSDSGRGEPLLFLPGMGSDVSMWASQVEAFSGEFRCICVDHRGIGKSTVPADEAYTMAALADDAVRVLDHLKIEVAHIIGASMGGVVAQHVALRHPGRVSALSLHSTWCKTTPLLRLKLQQQFNLLDHVDMGTLQLSLAPWIWSEFTLVHRQSVIEEFRSRRHPETPTVPPEVYRNQIAACLNLDITDRLCTINVPTLITSGGDDILIPSALSRVMAASIPSALYCGFPAAGHATMVECAEAFNLIQKAFVQRSWGMTT
jgi:3-oxoadipate enol-lactonase